MHTNRVENAPEYSVLLNQNVAYKAERGWGQKCWQVQNGNDIDNSLHSINYYASNVILLAEAKQSTVKVYTPGKEAFLVELQGIA